jgi:TM2 domain-containing membrane protein YozV
MDMTEIIKENLAYVVLIGTGLGVVLGLIPFVLAIRKGKRKLGLLAMVSSIVAGIIAVLSIGIILPLIVMAVFTWLILRKDPVSKPAVSTDASDSNTD